MRRQPAATSWQPKTARIRESSDVMRALTDQLRGRQRRPSRRRCGAGRFAGPARSAARPFRSGTTTSRRAGRQRSRPRSRFPPPLPTGAVVAGSLIRTRTARTRTGRTVPRWTGRGWLPVDIAERDDLATIETARHDAAGLLAEQTATAHDRRSARQTARSPDARVRSRLSARVEARRPHRIRSGVPGDPRPGRHRRPAPLRSRLPSSAREDAIHEIAGLSAETPTAAGGDPPPRRGDQRRSRAIDHNPGRYIRLVPAATPNTEIRQFREDLRACTSGMTRGTDDDQYSEERFLQVKALIDRLRWS